MKTKSIGKQALFQVLCLAVVALTAAAQTYKIGAKHPDGGLVFSVDKAGTSGFIVDLEDDMLAHEDAVRAAREQGEAWAVPTIAQLKEIYTNLHGKRLGNFKPQVYRSQEFSTGQYQRGLNFSTGKDVTGIGLNDKTHTRHVKRFSPTMQSASSPLAKPQDNAAKAATSPSEASPGKAVPSAKVPFARSTGGKEMQGPIRKGMKLQQGGGWTSDGMLKRGDELYSPNRKFFLHINGAGALEILPTDQPESKWSAGKDGSYAIYQEKDGNFVLYDEKGQFKWGTQANGSHMIEGKVMLNDKGVLEHFDGTNKPVWSSDGSK